MRLTRLLPLALVCGVVVFGNDGAASTAAGGIQLKREARISMEKERLVIGAKKITVEYEFLNETDRDITTEVAFPLAPYHTSLSGDGARLIDNFRVWIDGREITYQSDVRAMVGNVDFSARLRQLGVDIISFGHTYSSPPTDDLGKLSKQQQDQLRRVGLLDELGPAWTVELTHHWQQTFPAHKILHVRHEYTPVAGSMMTGLDDLSSPKPPTHHEANFAQWCIDPPLRKSLTAPMQKQGYGEVWWIDYILTTANTWKTPIKQFELVVERPKPDSLPAGSPKPKHYYVSFCWDGPVLDPDPDHFVARATNFVPTKELSIAFFPGD